MNNYNSCDYPMQRTKMYKQESCGCQYRDNVMKPFPENTALAMAFVPFQGRAEVYECDKALMRGTLFPCLDKPFLMGCCK